ncbi:MAG: amidinotransferase [Phaeodactylibacter sp.]|nr:amidinotransferase [Phaeodactylibacter sp.]MCB9277139.1 amidinotransferase [Lewinellaceae bacterium]
MASNELLPYLSGRSLSGGAFYALSKFFKPKIRKAVSTTKQITSHILMVRPANFGYNEQTAVNNAFQVQDASLSPQEISQKAVEEFDTFVLRLRGKGVDVIVVDDTPGPAKPDAVFPNNWATFHEDGRVVTYPMNAPLRRLERREDILQLLAERFLITDHLRFEHHEEMELFLEGTGSLILDRPNRLAYACLSPRTDEGLLDEFCQALGYQKVAFAAVDAQGREIYHTNVMMALGQDFVVICLESVPCLGSRKRLLQHFADTGKDVIEISLPQMMAFAGNMLQVLSQDGNTYLAMSEQAYHALTDEQIQHIHRYTNILYSPLYTIEKYGGGSARCMMAEVFLPER